MRKIFIAIGLLAILAPSAALATVEYARPSFEPKGRVTWPFREVIP